MRDALKKAHRAAVTRFAMRERESLALVRAKDNLLIFETLWWPDEVRSGAVEPPESLGSKPELKAMTDLIEAMTRDFDPDQYHNLYREALQETIDAKAAGREVEHVEAAEPLTEGKVGDLLSALKASVERAKATRDEELPAAKKRAA